MLKMLYNIDQYNQRYIRFTMTSVTRTLNLALLYCLCIITASIITSHDIIVLVLTIRVCTFLAGVVTFKDLPFCHYLWLLGNIYISLPTVDYNIIA